MDINSKKGVYAGVMAMTNFIAYADGRNKDYAKNEYYDSRQGIECYQIELGYIKTDLDKILYNKEAYINSITDAIKEYLEIKN